MLKYLLILGGGAAGGLGSPPPPRPPVRGPMGFGAHSRLHTTKVLRLSEDLPMIIEIVDSKEKIDELL